MLENNIKSFSMYREYVDLLSLLKKEEESDLHLRIMYYVFYDVEIKIEELSIDQRKIWVNLKRPIDKSKLQSIKVSKRHQENTNNDTELDTERYTEQHTEEDTERDTQSKMSMSMLNNKVLEKIGYGEEKPLTTVDNSSLLEIVKNIIQYLNEKTKANFRYQTKSTQQKINARLNEGYKLDDFIAVIDKKYDEWKGTEFENYLCPETLFGTKFEKYLNQKSKIVKPKEILPDWANKDVEANEVSDEEAQAFLERLGKCK